MAEKKTAVAMLGGCETGIQILRAESLLSSCDTQLYRESVRSAAGMVISCFTCQGNPEAVDDPEAFPCPVLADEANAIIINTVIQPEG